MPDKQLSSPGVGEAVFPLEIFELIIKFAIDSIDQPGTTKVPQLSRSDILSLGIVSRFFADICRPYLFRNVNIDLSRPLNQVQRLACLIHDNPTIADYVRNLSYAAARDQSPEDTSLDGFLHLPFIKYLKLNVPRRRDLGERDSLLPNSKIGQRTLLRRYIASNTLTSLHIYGMESLPILDIMQCPTLENLVLFDCEYQSYDHPDPAELETLAKGFNLRSFTLYYCRTTSDDGSVFPLLAFCPKLQEIDMKNSPYPPVPQRKGQFPALAKRVSSFEHVKVMKSRDYIDWTPFCNLADEAGVMAFPSLEDLHFRLCHSGNFSTGPNVIFKHIRSLKRLSITGPLGHSYFSLPRLVNWGQAFSASSRTLREISVSWQLVQGADEALISALCDGLQSVSHENVIQTIKLDLKLQPRDNYFVWTKFNHWTQFDLLMTSDSQAAFPHLQTVKISIVLCAEGDRESLPNRNHFESLKNYKEGLNTCLIRLRTLSDA